MLEASWDVDAPLLRQEEQRLLVSAQLLPDFGSQGRLLGASVCHMAETW